MMEDSEGRREELTEVIREIIETYGDERLPLQHLGGTPLPSERNVVAILQKLRAVLFPGYFGREYVNPTNVSFYVGHLLYEIYEQLSREFYKAYCQGRFRRDITGSPQAPESPAPCRDEAETVCLRFLRTLPALRGLLALDVEAALDGDPAAKSLDEVILSYPGVWAVTVYRVAHEIFRLKVPLIPRIMTEYAHRETGIDIHPGAEIGRRFFIDHGTGVVIGETSRIGERVKIYQGVTLGALSFPKAGAQVAAGKKRHPTIQDNVVIYSGATILGGDTIIGHDSVIGGNVWITGSVPPRTKVVMEIPKLRIKANE